MERDPTLAKGLRFAALDADCSAQASRKEAEHAELGGCTLEGEAHLRVARALEHRAEHYRALAEWHDTEGGGDG